MVELFPTRRRAEAFARALEGGSGDLDQSLRHLVETVDRLAAVPLVQPRPEFRDALRERLAAAAAVELPAQAAERAAERDRRGHTLVDRPPVVDDRVAARGRRRLVAAATGLVLLGGGTGVAAASEQALPGDMLYPVKRTLESAQVGLARGADGEGRALLDRATTRLDEAETIATGTDPSEVDLAAVDSTLGDFAADADRGGQNLIASYNSTGDASDLEVLRTFTSRSHDTLTELTRALPPSSQGSVREAASTVVALDDEALLACPDCTSLLPSLSLPVTPVSLPGLSTQAQSDSDGTGSGQDAGRQTGQDAKRQTSQQAGRPGAPRVGAGGEATGGSPAGRSPLSGPGPVVLPDVDTAGPGPARRPQGDSGAAPGEGGGAQQRPGVPDAPDAPRAPRVPTAPTVPGTPDIPRAPVPSLPGGVGGSSAPAGSQAPRPPRPTASVPGLGEVTETLRSLLDDTGDAIDNAL